MPYKTISIKLLRPTTSKRAYLDDAIRRYSEAFEYLLRTIRQKRKQQSETKVGFLKMMDKDMMAQLDQFDVQPFKDSLKLDVSMVLTTYQSRKRSEPKIGYPVSSTANEDIVQLVNAKRRLTQRQVDTVFDKYHKARPVLFCRFDSNRDYSILYDKKKDRFYARLFLFNLKNALPGTHYPEESLRYLGSDRFLTNNRRKKRFLVLPLEIGEWQKQHLEDIDQGRAQPKSAQLIREGDEYFLNVRIWYEPVPILDCPNYLGVCRGIHQELFYAVCNEDDQIIDFGPIYSNNENGKNRLHALSNRVIQLAKEKRCRIILCNLVSRSDGLNYNDREVPLSVGDYNSIINMVQYKAEFQGLQEPVIVSASGIFYRCPKCFTFKYSNRLDQDKFLCVRCGYFHGLELVGSSNLARTLINYSNNKIAVRFSCIDGKAYFSCALLDLNFSCEANEYMFEQFYQHLQQYVATPPRRMTKKQRSILHKFIAADEIRNCVAFVEQ